MSIVQNVNPTYGKLIDILQAAEIACEADHQKHSVAEVLVEKFTSNYPHISVSRPTRFLDTVRRLAAPTKPSALGEQKLLGSPLVTYRRRVWIPRRRHKQGIFRGVSRNLVRGVRA